MKFLREMCLLYMIGHFLCWVYIVKNLIFSFEKYHMWASSLDSGIYAENKIHTNLLVMMH